MGTISPNHQPALRASLSAAPAAPLGAGGGLTPGNVLHVGQALSRPAGQASFLRIEGAGADLAAGDRPEKQSPEGVL